MTPLGKPVVPLVYCIITTSSLVKRFSASRRELSGMWLPSSSNSGTL